MKKKKIIIVSVLIIAIVTIIGLSTAYFVSVIDKDDDNNVIFLSKQLSLQFTDGPAINLNGILPGEKIIKTFTVSNTGGSELSYNLDFVDVINELTRKNDLVYTITSTNNGYSNNNETTVPSSDTTLANNITIAANTTQTYTLTIEYKNADVNQVVDMNKSIMFKINISDPAKQQSSPVLAAGLYNDNDELIYSWDELIERDYIKVIQMSDDWEGNYDFDYETGDMILTSGSNRCNWNDTDCEIAGKIVIDDSIVYIYSGFEYSSITSAYIPANVKVMGGGFDNDKQLTSVTFAPNSQLIVLDGFEGTGLTSIEIPASVTYIETCAFTDAKDLASVTFESNSSLQVIEGRAFENTAFTSIDIPTSVTEISGDAFYGSHLTSVYIPANVESIGMYAFYDTHYLTSVTFAPNSHLTTIGESAFYDDYRETLIAVMNIPSTVTSIGYNAFYGVNVIMYDGPATDSDNWGAKSLNPYVVGDYVFADSNGTNVIGYIGTSNSISIPSGTTIISNSAFENNKFTSVAIPASVTTIGDSAFACNYDGNYESEISLTFAPNSQLTNLGTDVFGYCGLVSIDFGTSTNLTSIDFSSLGISYIGSLVLPNGITSIDENTFEYISINSITLPSTLRTIGNGAFESKNLTSVTFAPNSQLTTIGEYAFSNNEIDEMYIPSSVTTIGYDAFGGVDTIHYNGSAIDTYENNWGANNLITN